MTSRASPHLSDRAGNAAASGLASHAGGVGEGVGFQALEQAADGAVGGALRFGGPEPSRPCGKRLRPGTAKGHDCEFQSDSPSNISSKE